MSVEPAFPQSSDALTPGWLTARLRDVGVLATENVTAVTAEPVQTWHVAQLARLAVDYAPRPPADAPRRLLAKLSKAELSASGIHPGEMAFYAGPLPDGLPIPRCYGAFADPASDTTCILLEDLSDTHTQTAWPVPPSLAMCEAAARALARLHAAWWMDGTTGGLPPPDHEAGIDAAVAAHLPDFFDDLGDRLPPDRRDLMRRVCDRLPALKPLRFSMARAITRLHGDAHFSGTSCSRGIPHSTAACLSTGSIGGSVSPPAIWPT